VCLWPPMWWGTPAEKTEEAEPTVKAAAVEFTFAMYDMDHTRSIINDGLRNLFVNKQLCDLALLVKDERFLAHKAVLAAMSSSFCKYLATPHEADENIQKALVRSKGSQTSVTAASDPAATGASPEACGESDQTAPAASKAEGTTNGENSVVDPDPISATKPEESHTPTVQISDDDAGDNVAPKEGSVCTPTSKDIDALELQVQGIDTTEAMSIMLQYVYYVGTGDSWEYSPSSMAVNKDILRLASIFGLQQLHERAARWIAQGLTSSNVVERLVACEEHGLGALKEKIMTELTANPVELATISSSPVITQHPRILQDLLMRMASLCTPAAGKKGPPKAAETGADQPVEKPTDRQPKKRARKNA